MAEGVRLQAAAAAADGIRAAAGKAAAELAASFRDLYGAGSAWGQVADRCDGSAVTAGRSAVVPRGSRRRAREGVCTGCAVATPAPRAGGRAPGPGRL